MKNGNSIRQMRKVIRAFREGVLRGKQSPHMCFAVCLPLEVFLNHFGYKVSLREVEFPNTNHAFLEMQDGTIIDPTADQFNSEVVKFPKVYIGPMPEIYKKWMKECKSNERTK